MVFACPEVVACIRCGARHDANSSTMELFRPGCRMVASAVLRSRRGPSGKGRGDMQHVQRAMSRRKRRGAQTGPSYVPAAKQGAGNAGPLF